MTHRLTPDEYEPTKMKLAALEQQLATLERRADLPIEHQRLGLRSFQEMISQLQAELALYEAIQLFEMNTSASPR